MAHPYTYGWRQPALPHRPHRLYAAPRTASPALPDRVDLVPLCPPVREQAYAGACAGIVFADACEVVSTRAARDRVWQGAAPAPYSALWLYYYARVRLGLADLDSGVALEDVADVARRRGLAPDAAWPYDPSKWRVAPPARVGDLAHLRWLVNTEPLARDLGTLRAALAAGFPVACGIAAYPAIESDAVAATGAIPLPRAYESPVGGHALLLVGYDRLAGVFAVRNSWGVAWGRKGYGTIPAAYLLDAGLCGELYVVRVVR